MGDMAGEEARLRQVLARAAQWGVTSVTLLEVYPSRRVQQLSEIASPLRIRDESNRNTRQCLRTSPTA
jgi:hypothetical protein